MGVGATKPVFYFTVMDEHHAASCIADPIVELWWIRTATDYVGHRA